MVMVIMGVSSSGKTTIGKHLSKVMNSIFIDADEGSDACDFLKIRKLPSFYFYVNKDRQYVLESADEREISNFFKRVHGAATCF